MKPANFAPAYCAMYPKLAELARAHGYALAIHGTMGRDFDLVAIPWRDDPTSPRTLVDSITKKFAVNLIGDAEQRRHGRIAYTLSIGFGECAIDLSFVNSMQVPR